jgi:N-hydroxyarylamine O-acetyltransferase
VNLAAYLERIEDRGPLEANLSTLRRLHVAHLLHVPFENLDIPLGRPIVVEEAAFFRKIVEGRRGGFCYEQNGLFAWVLRQLGFQVTLLSARVVNQGVAGPEFDHLALRIDLPEGRWLADVGFGRSFREPLSLDTGADSEAEGARYRAVAGDPDWQVQLTRPGHPAEPQYLFTQTGHQLDAYARMCRFHQTSADSPFTRKRLCTLATPDGRLTFLNGTLIEDRAGTRHEHPLTPTEVAPTLRAHFGLTIPDAPARTWAAAG